MTASVQTFEGVGLDPLRDIRHREARAARDLADWLAGLELIPMATRWKRCILTADVRYRNPHMARHSFVARLREKSVRIEDIKWMVGHESIATTEDIYSHPDMSELGDRVRKLVGGAA